MRNHALGQALVIAVALLTLAPLAPAGDGQIDIAELPYTITAPGSYIVVADLTLTDLDTDGITILVDNVTLDLNGHTLTGPGASAGATGDGIDGGTRDNVVIRNGRLQGWRGSGIFFDDGSNGVMVSDIISADNGGSGIAVADDSRAERCIALGNGGFGIDSYFRCVLVDNLVNGNARGIVTEGQSRVEDNVCHGNTDYGIRLANTDTVAIGNLVTGNGIGIRCNDDTGNYIAANRASGNTADYDIAVSNTEGTGDLANVSF